MKAGLTPKESEFANYLKNEVQIRNHLEINGEVIKSLRKEYYRTQN
jgi:hypothetical protein